MKFDKMPTPMELMEKVGGVAKSVGYNQNRTILKYLDTPVLAYGLGFNGFVCIIKTKQKRIHSYSYGIKNPFDTYVFGGFTEIKENLAVQQIEKNPLLVYRHINKKDLNDRSKVYKRPVLGTFTLEIERSWSSENIKICYRVVALKSGKLRAEKEDIWSKRFSKIDLKRLYQDYKIATEKVMPSKTSFNVRIIGIKEDMLSNELIEKIEKTILAEEI